MCAQATQRFTFVNFSNPGEAKQKDAKKRVRSAAAFSGWDKRLKRQQHPDHPDHLGCDAEIKIEEESALVESTPISARYSISTDHVPATSLDSNELGDDRSLDELQLKQEPDDFSDSYRSYSFHSKTSEPQCRASEDHLESRTPQHTVHTRGDCADHAPNRCRRHSSIAASLHSVDSGISKPQKKRGSINKGAIVSQLAPLLEVAPSPDRVATNKLDPFNCYPVPNQPWYDWVLHHMLTVFAPRGWPALGITKAQGMSWEKFMTQHALEEPALFYVRLLFASGDLVSMHLLQPEISLWLRTQAVQAINQALNDQKRAVSDALILAVGRIALHESMYGDRIAANAIHRPAQFRMIMMRGGMQALNFPELVKRLMRWADRVMSMQSGTPRYLVEEESPSYTLSQSVDVLEKWVPHEGMALRQKVHQSQRKLSEQSCDIKPEATVT